MNTSREAAYTALFSLLDSLPLIKTATRRKKHWQDVPPEDQPALYMEHTGENAMPVKGLPTRVILEVSLWLYVKTDGDEVGPIINPILDQITQALEPPNTIEHAQTLNGVVHHAWIEGQTVIYEGDLGDEAVVVVPVKLLVT